MASASQRFATQPPRAYAAPTKKQMEELLALEASSSDSDAGAPTPGHYLGLALLAVALAGVAGCVGAALALHWHQSGFTRRPEGPAKPDKGAYGWQTTGGTVGGDHWCQVEVPAVNWNLRRCSSTAVGTPATTLKVLTYNLYWWNLFLQRGGNHSSAGKLIASAAASQPFDVMGFQECNDVGLVLRDAQEAGLPGVWRTLGPANPVAGAVAIAWREDVWRTLTFGLVDVAEDAPEEWWGTRFVAFVRLSNLKTGKKVFFMTHHGPLPVNDPGGLCGADATAYNMLKVMGYHAQPGDSVVLLGDFNAGKTSATVQRLSQFLDHVFSGLVYDGVDNVFATCATAVERRNLGTGGSDHDALSVVFQLA